MKKLFFVLGIVLSMSLLASAQDVKQPAKGKADKTGKVAKTEKTEQSDKTDKPVQTDKKGPIIEFRELTHDFGQIAYKGKATYDFEFTNVGDEPLVLQKPKPSCSCTVPEWPKAPIAPGETASIKVTYKNTHQPGTFNKRVTILSNDTSKASVILIIKGQVLGEVVPMKVDDGGMSPRNKEVRK